MEKAQKGRPGFKTQTKAGVGGSGEGKGARTTQVCALSCHGDSGGCVFTHSADIYGTVLGSGSLSLKPKQVPALL